MIRRIALAAAITSLVTGCATVNQPFNADTASAIKSQTVAVAGNNEKPNFVAMTAGKAAFAMLGAVAMIAAGNDIVKEHNVQDPAADIARALSARLGEKYGAQIAPASISLNSEDPAQLAAAANGKARYVFDVRTAGWSFAYFPTDWTHYRVTYTARARLIDAEKKTVIAESICSQVPQTNEGAPTYDELLANGAALLKSKLADAGKECVAKFSDTMFKV